MTDYTLAIRLTGDAGDLVGEIKVSEKALRGLGRAADETGKKHKSAAQDTDRLSDSQRRAGTSTRELNNQYQTLGSTLGNARRWMLGLVSAYSALAAARGVLNIAREADEWKGLQTQIRQATRESGNYTQVSRELYRQAQANGVALEANVTLFRNLSRSAAEVGAQEGEILKVTNAIQQLGVIGRSSTSAMQAGLLQFGQAMAGGIVRAEEWNSIVENLPELAVKIAQGMGKTVGQMRLAVNEGTVLSEQVFASILAQAPDIAREFEDMPANMSRASAELDNALSHAADRLDDMAGLSETFAGWMHSAAQGLDRFAERGGIALLDAVSGADSRPSLPGSPLDAVREQSGGSGRSALAAELSLINIEMGRLEEQYSRAKGSFDAISQQMASGVDVTDDVRRAYGELWKQVSQYRQELDPLEEQQAELIDKLKNYKEEQRQTIVTTKKLSAEEKARRKEIASLTRQMDDYLSLTLGLDQAEIRHLESIEQVNRAVALGIVDQQQAADILYQLDSAYLEVASSASSAAAEVDKLGNDAAKQAAEEAARQWQRSAEIIEQSLTDSLMRAFESGADFGEGFVDGIENLFRTLILRPTIQATVAPVANSLVGALGGGQGGGQGGSGLNLFSMAGSGLQALGGTSFLGTFGAGMQAGVGALGAGGLSGAAGLSSGLIGAGHFAMGIGAALPFALPIAGIAATLLGGLFDKEPDPRFNVGGPIGDIGITGTQDIKGDQQQLVNQLVATIDAFEDQFLDLLNDAERQAIAEAGGKALEKIHIESEHELTAAIIMRMKASVYAIDGDLGNILHDAIQEIRAERPHGSTLADADALVQDVLMPYLVVRDVMDRMGVELDGGLAGASQNIVAAAGGLETYQQGIARYFDVFYSQAEQFEQFQSDLAASLSDLGVDSIPATREAFRALVEDLDLTTLEGQQLHGALTALVPALASFYDQTERQAEQLSGLLRGVDDQLADLTLSDFQNELRDIARWLEQTSDSAREYGASQAQLAQIQQVAALRTREALASLQSQIGSLVEQLYGGTGGDTSGIDRLMQQEQTRLSELNTLARGLHNEEKTRYQLASRSADQIDDFLANLAVGGLSPLTPLQQYQSARGEYDSTLSAARRGDSAALGDITGRFNNLLTTSQRYNASNGDYVSDYTQGRADLLSLARELGAITDPGDLEDMTTSSLIQALESQRRVLQQQEAQADRRALALELVQGLSDMGIALDRSVLDLARDNGINLRDLATDIGINLNKLDRTLALQLIEAARNTGEHLSDLADVLGVDLERLAKNVGIDISRLTGDLSSDLALVANSLGVDVRWLSGAFGQSVDGLDDQFHTDISALINAVNALPPEQRAALAPYLTSISNTTLAAGRNTLAAIDFFVRAPGWAEAGRLLQSINTNTRHTVEQTYGVRQNLRNMAGAMGVRSYAVGTDFVPHDQVAQIHRGEMIIDPVNSELLRRYGLGTQNNHELVRELRELRTALARLQAQLSREHAQSIDQRGAIASAQLRQGDRLVDGMTPRASARAVA